MKISRSGQTIDTTQILVDLGNGDRSAASRLMPLVYDELRGLAARYVQHERPDLTLQATDLVHEAYLRLIDQSRVDWQNRAHFFAVGAEMIRRILVDHARRHRAAKRGGGAAKVTLTDSIAVSDDPDIDLVALDQALEELAKLNERHGKVVELRFFGRLSIDESAHVLGISTHTVRSDWRMARAWLRKRLERQ